MFTGLITEVGQIEAMNAPLMRVLCTSTLHNMTLGESVAVNGACLTVNRILPHAFEVALSTETLSRIASKNYTAGQSVNLERALLASDRLGGHFVQGHVDGVGQILTIEPLNGFYKIEIELPPDLLPLVVPKGSIAIDGISLTINTIEDRKISLMIIPHTWEHTCLKNRKALDHVNIEADMIGKYVQRLAHFQKEKKPLDAEGLRQMGY